MSLVVDIGLAILLISAIGYGMILNRKIVALRGDQSNLERLATSFHEATKRAEASVGKLKNAAQSASEILSGGIDEATRIREDLNFLVDRGEKLGDRLESSVRSVENVGSCGSNLKQSKVVLNSLERTKDPISAHASERRSSKPAVNLTPFDAELLGNKIVKSEVEREFIQALKAVR